MSATLQIRVDSFTLDMEVATVDVFDFEIQNPSYQRLLGAANPTDVCISLTSLQLEVTNMYSWMLGCRILENDIRLQATFYA